MSSLDINKKISKYNHTVYSNRNIKYIVIHWVGSVSSAKNNADYFYNGDRQASAHYFVDDNSIWQVVLEKNAAWAVGGGPLDQGSPYAKYGKKYFGKCTNANSISIEMCCKKDSKGKLYISDETIKRTAKLVQNIQKRHGIPDSKVIRHFDVNGKICPGTHIEQLSWDILHSKLTGNYIRVKTKGELIAREGYKLSSAKTRTLTNGYIYGIIQTKTIKIPKSVKRGRTIKGDWITITSKYVDIIE